jgi:hypothetical protein
MKIRLVCWLNLLALAATASSALADARSNPYEPIVERNPFGLKPPPPPPTNEPPPPPPAPAITVKLTGIISFLSGKKALLEITEPGGKNVKKPIMLEGERQDAIEVISIDVEHNLVKIKNAGVETNLTFEKIETAKAAPAGAPAAPGFVPPGAPRTFPAPLGTPGAAPQPTLINPSASAGGAASGSGRNAIVTMGGGGGAATPAPAYGATPAAYGGAAGYPGSTAGAATPSYNSGYPGVSAAGAAGAAATDASGLRQIPSRQIRTDIPSPTATSKPMSVQDSQLLLELNRQANEIRAQQTGRQLPPLPPTRFTPIINQQ